LVRTDEALIHQLFADSAFSFIFQSRGGVMVCHMLSSPVRMLKGAHRIETLSDDVKLKKTVSTGFSISLVGDYQK
jgi:hypothetical protein